MFNRLQVKFQPNVKSLISTNFRWLFDCAEQGTLLDAANYIPCTLQASSLDDQPSKTADVTHMSSVVTPCKDKLLMAPPSSAGVTKRTSSKLCKL